VGIAVTAGGWATGPGRIIAVTLAIVAASFVVRAAGAPPELTQPVNDFAMLIDPDTSRRLEELIRKLEAATGDVVVVATVPTVEPYPDARAYAVEMFENHGRGIGQRGKDNGVLVLLALKERTVWVEAGYGLEEWITDGFAGETSREYMTPEFRAGRYGAGLLAGTGRIVARIAEGRNVTLTGVELPVARRVPRDVSLPLPVIILLFLAIVLLSRKLGGPGRVVRRWDRGGWSGWSSGVGPFGGGSWSRGGAFGGGFGGFGGFGGGRSGGGGGGASW
jgi:uncharacterized protein